MTKANELLDALKFAQSNERTVSYEAITQALLAVIDEVERAVGDGMLEMEQTIRTKSMHMKGLHERVMQHRAALATINKAKEVCGE